MLFRSGSVTSGCHLLSFSIIRVELYDLCRRVCDVPVVPQVLIFLLCLEGCARVKASIGGLCCWERCAQHPLEETWRPLLQAFSGGRRGRPPLEKVGRTKPVRPTNYARGNVTRARPSSWRSCLPPASGELAILSSRRYGWRTRGGAWPPARRMDPRVSRLVLRARGEPGRSPGP